MMHAAGPAVAPATADSPVPSVVVPSVKAAVDAGVDSHTKNKAFNLGLKWNENARHFSVAVPNSKKFPLDVIGVQPSGGLFITSIPKVIPAQGTADVNVLLVGETGSVQETSVLRVLTSGGEIVVQVNHTREQVAQFDSTKVKWIQGSKPAAQTVTLTMAPNTAVPTGVRVMGSNATAKLTALGNSQYSITLTPISTANASTFPAVVSFQPSLPGVSGVIGCEISP